MPRLIWVFIGCTVILLVLSCRGSYVNNKGWDQLLHWCSLISTFVVHCVYSIISIVAVPKIFKTLASLCSWAGWFESYLVAISWRQVFSRDGSSNGLFWPCKLDKSIYHQTIKLFSIYYLGLYFFLAVPTDCLLLLGRFLSKSWQNNLALWCLGEAAPDVFSEGK